MSSFTLTERCELTNLKSDAIWIKVSPAESDVLRASFLIKFGAFVRLRIKERLIKITNLLIQPMVSMYRPLSNDIERPSI